MIQQSKIAIVSGGLQFGGSTSFVLNLLTGFQAIGVPSAVFSFRSDHAFAAEFAATGIPVHISDEKRFIFEDRLTSLYQKIAEFKPTTILANIGTDAYEMLRYMPPGVGRLGMVHDLAMEPSRLIPTYEHYLDGVAVVNSCLVEDVRRAAPLANCQYLAHGIPFSQTPSRAANPSVPLKIIYFGRLCVGKGTRDFGGIINELHKRGIPFQFRIHGRGPEEAYLRETLADYISSGSVVLSSDVPRSELYPLIRQHDIFIMASDIEGGPLTLLEAMSLGLVPVCNDIPCLVQEVINIENGFCIPRSAEKYADAIALLHHDRPRLERMSVASRTTVTEHFSSEAMAQRYMNFLKSLPHGNNVEWPARIHPRPILGASSTLRITQTFGVFRQARRVLRKIRSATSL
jgi:glycosyltransferase involved in cell wall biosynthesis